MTKCEFRILNASESIIMDSSSPCACAMTRCSWLFKEDVYLFTLLHSFAAKDSEVYHFFGDCLLEKLKCVGVVAFTVGLSYMFSCCFLHYSQWIHQRVPQHGPRSAATWASTTWSASCAIIWVGDTLSVQLKASPSSQLTSCLRSVLGCGPLLLMRCTLQRFAKST